MPSELQTSRIFFLVSAILNIVWAVGGSIYVFILGIASCGIGCLFFIIPVINIVACVMDFIAYNKLNSLDRPGTFGSMQFAAISDITTILTGNIISMVFGIITLMNLNNENVKTFLREMGIY